MCRLCSTRVQINILFLLGLINAALMLYIIYTMQSPKNLLPTPQTTIKAPISYTYSGKLTTTPITTKKPNKEDIYTIINPFICENEGKYVKLAILIPSDPSREGARMAIRRTWGYFAIRTDVLVLFIIGKTNNVRIQKNIEKELYMYGDILQVKFIDTYDNLTLKSISMIRWVKDFCPKANYILKSDDDVFVNVPRIFSFMSTHKLTRRVIYGNVIKYSQPIRDKKSKHYISEEEYSSETFPDYAQGPAYLIPARLSSELYNSALKQKLIKLEDVFLTGIVANDVNFKRINIPEFRTGITSKGRCFVHMSNSIHSIGHREQFEYWKQMYQLKEICKKYYY